MDFLDPQTETTARQFARRAHKATSYVCAGLLIFTALYVAAIHGGAFH